MQLTEARFNIFLHGLLLGAFSFAFVFNQLVALNAVLFLSVIFVLLFILKYRNTTREDLVYLLGGIVLSIILIVVIPALSPATLSAVMLLIALTLYLLIEND